MRFYGYAVFGFAEAKDGFRMLAPCVRLAEACFPSPDINQQPITNNPQPNKIK